MGTKQDASLLPGTLDLLLMKALLRGPAHGYDIAQWILARSGDVLIVEEGALYPALHRLELRGWVAGAWGQSANNRRAKFYSLTAEGRAQLELESAAWSRLSGAVTRVLATEMEA